MKKLIIPKFIAKSHVAAYTRKDGTFVAAHDDKRQKHADLKPEHLYSKLAEAEDNGGRAAVHGLAHEIIQHRPDLEDHVRREAADLGHSLPAPGSESKGSAKNTSGSAEKRVGPSANDVVADEIGRHMDADPYGEWGLRVIPRGFEVEEGDQLPNSKRWVDGEDTGEELNGVSTIGVKRSSIDQALKVLRAGGYSGEQIALVVGDRSEAGDDAGEKVIKDGKVVAVWSKIKVLAKSLVLVRADMVKS